MPRTENTIIVAFRSSAEAEAAATELEAAGISGDDIDLETGTSGETAASSTKTSLERGITGWFKSLFTEEDDPDRIEYENAMKQGNCLLRVDVDADQIPTAEAILNRHSPIDVHAGTAAGATASAAPTRDTQAIPVVKEEIRVGKRQVLRGGVRVYTRVTEEPVEERFSAAVV